MCEMERAVAEVAKGVEAVVDARNGVGGGSCDALDEAGVPRFSLSGRK